MKVLLVEDEESIREIQKLYLERDGFTVIEAGDGKEALELFQKNRTILDLIILDLNIPFISGIDVCKTVKKFSDIPVIMVTAKTQELEELLGLSIGADDYIKKPFSPSIFLARVRNVLGRQPKEIIKIANLIINTKKMTVTIDGLIKELTTTQFNILQILAESPGIVFSREQLLKKVRTPDSFAMERTIDAHIKSLRKIIEIDPADPQYIITIIGKGYKISENIHEIY